jgi:hypothetical protein
METEQAAVFRVLMPLAVVVTVERVDREATVPVLAELEARRMIRLLSQRLEDLVGPDILALRVEMVVA